MAAIRVSVVIPARNASDTLGRAVGSVLLQSLPPHEIIVVDDASSDDTADQARTWPGVKVLTLPSHKGAAAARNAGIRAANGDWIAFLDADDEWLPQKLERQVACIAPEARPSLLFCASEEYGPQGSCLGDTFRGKAVDTGIDAWKTLLERNFVATPTVMVPRALVAGLGGFDEALVVGEDQDMWIRLALAGRLAYVAETLVRVHVQASSLSSFRPADQAQYVLPMIERHLRAVRSRLSREEVRTIRGERLVNAAGIAQAHGDVLAGAGFLLRAVALGYRRAAWALAKTPVRAATDWATRSAPRRQAA